MFNYPRKLQFNAQLLPAKAAALSAGEIGQGLEKQGFFGKEQQFHLFAGASVVTCKKGRKTPGVGSMLEVSCAFLFPWHSLAAFKQTQVLSFP